MTMESVVDQMCDEIVLLGSTGQKLSMPRMRMASIEPGKLAWITSEAPKQKAKKTSST